MIVSLQDSYSNDGSGGIVESVTATGYLNSIIDHYHGSPPAVETTTKGVPYSLTMGRGIGVGLPVLMVQAVTAMTGLTSITLALRFGTSSVAPNDEVPVTSAAFTTVAAGDILLLCAMPNASFRYSGLHATVAGSGDVSLVAGWVLAPQLGVPQG